ncbi:hypothetical protein GGF46_003997 [Coemansia sp. RSA 552]|nr:hypothetical protein GGF46_003997 [Coemansia sp. RSA 552]
MPAAPKAATELAKRLIAANPVMIFAKSHCSYCKQAKSKLEQHKIAYYAIDLDKRAEGDGADIQNSLLQMTGQKTVPNIFAYGHHIGGCSETLDALASGKLQQILDKKVPGKFIDKATKSATPSESDSSAPSQEARI